MISAQQVLLAAGAATRAAGKTARKVEVGVKKLITTCGKGQESRRDGACQDERDERTNPESPRGSGHGLERCFRCGTWQSGYISLAGGPKGKQEKARFLVPASDLRV